MVRRVSQRILLCIAPCDPDLIIIIIEPPIILNTNKLLQMTRPLLELEEKIGKHFEGKPIVKLGEGGELEFNGATIRLNNGVYSIEEHFHDR